RELQSELLEDLAEEAVRAAVHVLAGDDVIARFQQAEDGIDRRHPGCEAVPVLSSLQCRECRLRRETRRILRACVLESLVPAELRLHVGRGLEDGNGYGAGSRLRLLACVDAIGGETHSGSLCSRN